jgi:hypothetical protein
MLFDKTPEEVLSEDQEAKARRLREEREARERWQQELENGRRQREEKKEVARRFQEKVQDLTPAGRAKAAKESGASVFQLTLPLAVSGGYRNDPLFDHNPVLNVIEAQGWRLTHANYVTGQPTPDAPAGDPQHPEAALFAIYVFRRSI